jgi:homoserine O-acetyltransferase
MARSGARRSPSTRTGGAATTTTPPPAIARSLAQITYRSDDVFTDRFGREAVESLDGFSMWQRFEVERYLEYHGDKLVRRFDANTYLVLSKAMDLHDVGRGRGGAERALARVTAPALVMGVTSDTLYWLPQQRQIVDLLRDAGGRADYVEIDSPHGHDAFLLEFGQLGAAVTEFLTTVEKDDA